MESIDVALSFDTTGSMYPCLTQVRKNVSKLVNDLFEEIPNIRIAIMAHGDYCDGKKVLTVLDFSDKPKKICEFVNNVKSTYGGDTDECYEFVLNQARQLSWTSGKNKAFVMIGDANPHKVGYRYDGVQNKLDWKNEASLLVEAGISIYPVQALNRAGSTKFYQTLAEISNTPKLNLNQFSEINDIINALCYQRAGKIEDFEKKLVKRNNVSYNVLSVVDSLAGRKTKRKQKRSKKAASVSRFQILSVDHNQDIKGFVEDNGLLFKTGRGFYEFTKTVTIQDYKEVIAEDKETGEVFEGSEARKLLGIPVGRTSRVKPSNSKFRGYVQSTSHNRKLLSGTNFLYEVDESR